MDVLGEAEPIKSPAELDVKRYGVIVTKGMKRGLLLPDLDGVDTVEEQISIGSCRIWMAWTPWRNRSPSPRARRGSPIGIRTSNCSVSR